MLNWHIDLESFNWEKLVKWRGKVLTEEFDKEQKNKNNNKNGKDGLSC
jgi:hypothetical protein